MMARLNDHTFRHTAARRRSAIRGAASILLAVAWGVGGCASGPKEPVPVPAWGTIDYAAKAKELEPVAEANINTPLEERSKDAGVVILDYASACMAAGRTDTAQQALYEAILLTNDMTLGEAEGSASMIFAESLKLWQGEAYERAMIELLHGICLMQQGDYGNARVAFDRAIMTDGFSKGGIDGVEGESYEDHGLARLRLNDSSGRGGGSICRRDFLAAYVLRTLCYLHENRPTRAEESWKEAQTVYHDILDVDQRCCEKSDEPDHTWTGDDGTYAFPSVYLPPAKRCQADGDSLFDLSIEELHDSNLVVIAATGSRPRKILVGRKPLLGGDVKYVHDNYCPPACEIETEHLVIDGAYAGEMNQCLDLYGQAAGRGPSVKDAAQKTKEFIENLGEFIEDNGPSITQYAGTLIRVINQEKADIRQWQLLPNNIHVWIGSVEPGRRHLACLPIGGNVPSIEMGVEGLRADALQALEQLYVAAHRSADERNGDTPWAARHTRVAEAEVTEEGLTTVFLPEDYNAHVTSVPVGEPTVYELKPRRTPQEDDGR